MGPLPSRGSVTCDVILGVLSYATPKQPSLIAQLAADELGHLTDRSVYRHLKSLLASGRVGYVNDEDCSGYLRMSERDGRVSENRETA